MESVNSHLLIAGGRRIIHHTKTFFIDNHMIIFMLPILIAAILHSRFSREQIPGSTVVEGRIVACRHAEGGGPCIADIEFRMGDARVKKRAVRLQKPGNCMIGQTVKVHYSSRSKQIDIIE